MQLGTLKEIQHVNSVCDRRTNDKRLTATVARLSPRLRRLVVLRRLHEIYGHDRLHRMALTLGCDSLAKVRTTVLVQILKLIEC